jgi:hypothetical protein
MSPDITYLRGAVVSAAHTPTPWKMRKGLPQRYPEYVIEGPGAEYIAGVQIRSQNPAHDNAAFIVRACNSHAALVAALDGLLNADTDEAIIGATVRARAALKAATPHSPPSGSAAKGAP